MYDLIPRSDHMIIRPRAQSGHKIIRSYGEKWLYDKKNDLGTQCGEMIERPKNKTRSYDNTTLRRKVTIG